MTNTTRKIGDFLISHLASPILFCAALLSAPTVEALELDLPVAGTETFTLGPVWDSFTLPTGPHNGEGQTAVALEGMVSQMAWRLDTQGLTTLQVLAPLRSQLAEAGYNTLFECEDQSCGGFDFRFAYDVIPAPDMYVDIFDFRYFAAERATEKGPSYVAVLISRSNAASFVQLTQISPDGANHVKPGGAVSETSEQTGKNSDATRPALNRDNMSFSQQLSSFGSVILSDLVFETGSSNLGNGDYASLKKLANFLLEDPTRQVALVGHTDAVGSLENNIALSKKRARSVRTRLVEELHVPVEQLAAEGMGYLSPVTSNLTQEGREKNRRVEVILLNTE